MLQEQLVKLLLRQEEYMMAQTAAAALHCSVRTVKKYIAELNGAHPGLIQSAKKGYLINKDEARAIFDTKRRDECPQTSEDRTAYIIKALLQKTGETELSNIYDFAEEMYVSYTTVKRVLNGVRSICQEYGLTLTVSGDFFSMEGSESNKRRLMSTIYYQEFEKNDLSLSSIQKVFSDYDVTWIKDVVINRCKKYHYYVNGYALVNLILDIVISLDRIKRKFYQEEDGEPDVKSMMQGRERALAMEIAGAFEEQYHVIYSDQEIASFTLLLMSHLLRIDYKKIDYNHLNSIVGKECMALTEELLADMREYYLLGAEDEEFYVRFTMHINNLLLRARTGYINKNPLIETIKTGCPLLFDCAVSMCNIIKNRTGYEIAEDEIAYIALHIGTLLEMNENPMDKLKCTLIFPQYYDFSSKLEKKLEDRYGNVFEIVNVITDQEELMNEEKTDLIISTIPVSLYCYDDVVVIHSILTDRDYDSIDRHIEAVRRRRKREILLEQLLAISNPALFHRNVLFENKQDIIHFMMQDMIDLGYADESYEKGVMERERLSSTAFDCIAVPHSMEMNAKKTGMYILIYDRPVPWGNKFVQMILLFTISREEMKLFRTVFDNLVVLLMDRANLNRVIQSRTYNEMIEKIIECSD